MSANSENAYKNYLKGLEEYNNQKYRNALKYFENAITEDDENAEYYYYAGLCEYEAGNYQEALDDFYTCTDIEPENAEYYFRKGLCNFKLDNPQDAVDDFTKGIENKPDDIYIYYKNRGTIKQIKLNDKEGAALDFHNAIKNAKNDKQRENAIKKWADVSQNLSEKQEKINEETINDPPSTEVNINKEANNNNYSYFGIDFGTTNSALVSVTGTGSHIKTFMYGDETGYPMPSLVAIKKDGTKIITGSDVKDNLTEYLTDDYYYFESIKSIINTNKEWKIADRVYTPIDIATELFKSLCQKVNKRGDQICKAVVAIPIGFTSKEKECLRKAAQNAGFEITMFVSEPTAAFCCNYSQLRDQNNIAVFDWGGGTLDISILNVKNGRVSEIATGGIKLAGDDIDKKLAEQAHKNFCKKNNSNRLFDEVPDEMKYLLLAKSERAKCNFSDQDEVSIKLNNYLDSQLRFDISYEQFKNLIENEVDKAVEGLEKTITKANLNTETLDCVLCVGGSSNLRPLIEKILKKYGNKLLIPESTGWNIAKGAALIATRPGKYALSRPIGLVLSDDSFLPLLEEGQPIPCNGAPPITLALTEGYPNEDKNANFVFADAEYETDRTFNDYKQVPVRAYDDEKIKLSYYIDPNFTFKAKIESNKKYPEVMYDRDKLNVYYQIER